jgi:4-alpha-glucanotransferase
MLDDVLRHHAIDDNDLYAVATFLSKTKSRLLAISLEDILGVIDQPNIPGTVNEHPNWRQRLPVSVNDIAHKIDIEALKDATTERANSHRVSRAKVNR